MSDFDDSIRDVLICNPDATIAGVIIDETSDDDWIAIRTAMDERYIVSLLPPNSQTILWNVPIKLLQAAEAIEIYSNGTLRTSLQFDPSIDLAQPDVKFAQTRLGEGSASVTIADTWQPWRNAESPFRGKAHVHYDYVVPFAPGHPHRFGAALSTKGSEQPLGVVDAKLAHYDGPGLQTSLAPLSPARGGANGLSAPSLTISAKDADKTLRGVRFVYWRYPQADPKNEPQSWLLADHRRAAAKAPQRHEWLAPAAEAASGFQGLSNSKTLPATAPDVEVISDGGDTIEINFASCGLLDIIGLVSEAGGPWLQPANAPKSATARKSAFFKILDVREGVDLIGKGLRERTVSAAQLAKMGGGEVAGAMSVENYWKALEKASGKKIGKRDTAIHIRASVDEISPQASKLDFAGVLAQEPMISVIARSFENANRRACDRLAGLSLEIQAELIRRAIKDNLRLDVLADLIGEDETLNLSAEDLSGLHQLLSHPQLALGLATMPEPPAGLPEMSARRDTIASHFEDVDADLDALRNSPLIDDFNRFAKSVTGNPNPEVDAKSEDALTEEQKELLTNLRVDALKQRLTAYFVSGNQFRNTNDEALEFLTGLFVDLGWLQERSHSEPQKMNAHLMLDLAEKLEKSVGNQRRVNPDFHEPTWEEPLAKDWRDKLDWIHSNIEASRKTLETGGASIEHSRRLKDALNKLADNARWAAHFSVWRNAQTEIEAAFDGLADPDPGLSEEIQRFKLKRQGPPHTWPSVWRRIEAHLPARYESEVAAAG